jgi:hypothetical protein
MPTGYIGALLAIVAALVAVRLLLSPRSPGTLQQSLAGLSGWHVADRVRLADQTLDHVIVAPAALLAVTEAAHAPGSADLHGAEKAAHRLRQFAHAEGVAEAVVVPVVRVSGPEAPAGGHSIVDGVHVIDESTPVAWLRLFRDPRLEAKPRVELARALDRLADSSGSSGSCVRADASTDLPLIVPPDAAAA